MRKWLVFVSFLVIVPVSAQDVSQKDSSQQIELGVNLTIGMPQQQALAAVGKRFQTRPLEDGSHYVVYAKPAEGEKPKWEGILTFKAGKLTGVERLWAYDDDERSVALAKSLFGALTSVVRSGKSTCIVEDNVSDTPDAQGETVYLNCGKRSIKISVAKVGDYKEDASVSELLEQ